MSLTPEHVDRIAALARLSLADEEREAFRRQLSSILDYVGKLSAVDTEGVEPAFHAVPVHNVFGADEVAACPDGVRDAIVDAFPDRHGDELRVKAVFS